MAQIPMTEWEHGRPEQIEFRYRKPVEAIQFNGRNAAQIFELAEVETTTNEIRFAHEDEKVRFLRGLPPIHIGDWLVKRPIASDVPGHMYRWGAFKDEDFRDLFEPVKEETDD